MGNLCTRPHRYRSIMQANPYSAITPQNQREWQLCNMCKAKGIRFNLPCIWCDARARNIYMREYDPHGTDIVTHVANTIFVTAYLDEHPEHPGMSEVDAFRCILHERDLTNRRVLAHIY